MTATNSKRANNTVVNRKCIKTVPEWSSRGVANMPEATVEVICQALDCEYNDKSREEVAKEGFCTLASVKVRSCGCYKMDKEWMDWTLKTYLGFTTLIFPKKLSENKEWSEL